MPNSPLPAQSNIKGAVFALMGFAFYALHDVLVKVLGAHHHPFQIVFFSVLLSFPFLTVVLIQRKEPASLRAVKPAWTYARTVAVVFTGVCAFYAFSVLPLAQVYAMIFATPLLITILSIPVLGENVGPRRWAAVVVGLIGVIVVLRPGSSEITLGHLAALGSAVGGSFVAIIVRRIGSEESSMVLLLYPLIANVLLMGALIPLEYRPMELWELGTVAAVALLSLLGMTFMIRAYKTGEAGIVAPMQYSQMLWAIFYGYMFFNEYLDVYTMVGAGIIIASGVYIVVREGSKKDTVAPVTNTAVRFETGTTPRYTLLFLRKGKKRQSTLAKEDGVR
ncbi:DMT family transporter [Donghicola mangrovi]|uniref:DMT family transporter n=1 Tax=Donghicola mangrovi TaxID=2729614 RepID=A0A850QBY0_9RHOB|nr:DMT family transporter [Donghicola mangrovi]NVO24448.1 DMT family transporter [Donghicola mangrovi]